VSRNDKHLISQTYNKWLLQGLNKHVQGNDDVKIIRVVEIAIPWKFLNILNYVN
jgi:hypothetical protein